jgi:hypothetical protein
MPLKPLQRAPHRISAFSLSIPGGVACQSLPATVLGLINHASKTAPLLKDSSLNNNDPFRVATQWRSARDILDNDYALLSSVFQIMTQLTTQ